MRAQLTAIAAQQGGVFTRRQAIEAGYSDDELRALVRPGGQWLVVRRAVYVGRETWDGLDEWTGKPLARDWAAHLTMTKRHLMSHHSAGRAHRLSMLRPTDPTISHVTRPGVGGSRTEHGVKHHRNQKLRWEGAVAGGLPVTPLARTALDIAREDGIRAGTCAVDSALRAGAAAADFHRALAQIRQFPWSTRAKAAFAAGDPGAANAGETLARELVAEVVVGEIRTQYPVRVVDGRVFWIDLVVGCHCFEFDGKVKLMRPTQGGVADRPPEEIVWDEKERQRLVCAEGLGMSRIIWADFWGEAREQARARLRAEAAVTQHRFGRDRPAHMDQLAEQLADERRARIRGDFRGAGGTQGAS